MSRTVTVNLNVAATANILGDVTRLRVKEENGHVMFLPTSRKLVSNLPKNEVARKLTRKTRGGAKFNMPRFASLGDTNRVMCLMPAKHGWMVLVEGERSKIKLPNGRVRYSPAVSISG